MTKATPNTLEISQKAKPLQIHAVAAKAGIRVEEMEPYGSYKAKVSLSILDRYANKPYGKLICVSGMTPTREGDGKTTTAIGLTQAFGALKKKVMLCLREPSLAPIFGNKGGGTGAGRSQVVPMDDINLHFTGDSHAVAAAHNLLAAALDNHIHQGNELDIDPERIFWKRAIDIGDRSLREIVSAAGKGTRTTKRKTGFEVTAASEVMAALSLSSSLDVLKSKLGKIAVALTRDGKLVTAKDLHAAGAMALLLKDAIKPNLVQTLEGQPTFMHTGPFANVSHGNSSILATQIALKLANYVITESGFATDLGLEKFFDIVCREGRFKPSVVVLVVSVKALKSHGVAPGKRGIEQFRDGFDNLDRHVANVRRFGLPVVVAINRFPQDTADELKIIRDHLQITAVEGAVSEAARLGGEGGIELAEKVLKVLSDQAGDSFKPLYELSLAPSEKIERIATELYGASGIDWSEDARADLEEIHRLKLDHLPVCIAKTPYSLTHDPQLKGAPLDWRLKVRRVRFLSGAGFLVALTGETLLMPGLPAKPMLEQMDVTDGGETQGLF